MKTGIAIFASGTGSNAGRIIDYFKDHPLISVKLVVCNNAGAGVIRIASDASVPVLLIDKKKFSAGDAYLPELRSANLQFIVLAGFLWKVPQVLIEAFPQRIINIHPALLPLHGGKGMYGQHVHEAVIASGQTKSGITIHYVDAQYDHGAVIFQAECPVEPQDTPHTLAQKIRKLEHRHFPLVIEAVIRRMNNEP